MPTSFLTHGRPPVQEYPGGGHDGRDRPLQFGRLPRMATPVPAGRKPTVTPTYMPNRQWVTS